MKSLKSLVLLILFRYKKKQTKGTKQVEFEIVHIKDNDDNDGFYDDDDAMVMKTATTTLMTMMMDMIIAQTTCNLK